ncbi:MAG: DNA polymerase I, partial [Acidimicrobiales bacterium]
IEMMVLVRDVELPYQIDELTRGESDSEGIKKLFDFLEFRRLWDRLAPVLGVAPAGAAEVLEPEITVYESAADAVGALAAANSGTDVLALAVPDGGVHQGLAFVVDGPGAEVGFVEGRFLEDSGVRDALSTLLNTDGRPVAMHGAKPTMRGMLDMGVDLRDLSVDTRLAAYLLDPADSRYDLGELLLRYASLEMATGGAPEGQLDLEGGEQESAGIQAAREALAVDRLVMPLSEAMASQGLLGLHDDLEIPLVRVLAKMEHRGIGVDPDVLTRIRDELNADTDSMRAAVIAEAGH